MANLLADAQAKRWQERGWTAEQEAMLGTVPYYEMAEPTGRTAEAVRLRRTRLGIPMFCDRRRGEPKRRWASLLRWQGFLRPIACREWLAMARDFVLQRFKDLAV